MSKQTFSRSCGARILDLLSVAILIGAAMSNEGEFDGSFWTIVIAVGLIRGVLALASRASDEGNQERAQVSRDESAREIQKALERGESPRFGLFLRAFELEGQTLVDEPKRSRNILSINHNLPASVTLETRLARCMAPEIAIVSLGRLGHVGPGLLDTPDESWRQTFALMARAAAVILIFPAPSKGLCEEIATLGASDWLDKCVWLLPPNPTGHRDSSSEFWTLTASALGVIGIEIPRFDEGGLVFTLAFRGASGGYRPSRVVPFPSGSDERLAACIRSISERAAPQAVPIDVEQTVDAMEELSVSESLSAARSDGRPFWLHLMTNHAALESPDSSKIATVGPILAHTSAEDKVEYSLQIALGPVMLGERKAHIASGKLASSAESWEQLLEEACVLATHVLLSPLAREGLEEDVRVLRRAGCLAKCVIYMPMADPGRTFDVASAWERSREQLELAGVHAPPHATLGGCFQLDRLGGIAHSAGIGEFLDSLRVTPQGLATPFWPELGQQVSANQQ
jgi:hypothetical protein